MTNVPYPFHLQMAKVELRQADISLTMDTYSHVLSDMQQEAVAAIEAALSQPVGARLASGELGPFSALVTASTLYLQIGTNQRADVALMPALVLAPLALVAHRPHAARQPPWAADG